VYNMFYVRHFRDATLGFRRSVLGSGLSTLDINSNTHLIDQLEDAQMLCMCACVCACVCHDMSACE